jgi:hypothetical protein
MLIKPNTLSVAPTSVVVVQKNEFFELILVKPRRSILSLGFFSTKETYYITLLVSRCDATAGHYLAIAQSDVLKDIESEWNFIKKNIYPNLSLAEDRREEQLAFLEQKFFLEAQHTEEQVIRNENILEFHSLFPTIPSEFCILGTFSTTEINRGALQTSLSEPRPLRLFAFARRKKQTARLFSTCLTLPIDLFPRRLPHCFMEGYNDLKRSNLPHFPFHLLRARSRNRPVLPCLGSYHIHHKGGIDLVCKSFENIDR